MEEHPWEIKPRFLNDSLKETGRSERNDDDDDDDGDDFFFLSFFTFLRSILFYLIEGRRIRFVTHTKISMGYLVAPDKSAFGGIRSLTRASNPPGTGTLKRRTTGCDFSAIISETASFASHVSIFVEF